jgi:hypothetical protein
MLIVCLRIVAGESSIAGDDASSSSVAHHTGAPTIINAQTPPPLFANAVLKLTGFLVQTLPVISRFIPDFFLTLNLKICFFAGKHIQFGSDLFR